LAGGSHFVIIGVIAKVMINQEDSDQGKADALVRRKQSIECSGRGRPPCHQLINPTLLQLPRLNANWYWVKHLKIYRWIEKNFKTPLFIRLAS